MPSSPVRATSTAPIVASLIWWPTAKRPRPRASLSGSAAKPRPSSASCAITRPCRRSHAAEARLEATLGVEPAIGSVFDTSLADLTRQLGSAAQQTLAQKLTPASKTPPAAVKPAVKPEVKPAPKPETKPEVKSETKPETKPAAKPEVKTEAVPAAKPAAKPEPAKQEPAKSAPGKTSASEVPAATADVAVQDLAADRSPAAAARREELYREENPLLADRSVGNFAYGGLQVAQSRSRQSAAAEGRQ